MAVRHELVASVTTDLLFEEPGVARCLVAPDGSVLRVNAEWLRSTGFALDDVLGHDIVGLFPDTRDMSLALHERVRGGHRVEVPAHAQRIQGRITWWEGSIAPVSMEGGTGLLITAREVSGRSGTNAPDESPAVEAIRQMTRRAESAERAEAALAHAGAIAQLGAWWIDVADEHDLGSNPLRWSDETYRIFGYEPRAVPVTNDMFFEHVVPDDRRRVMDTVAAALASDGRYSVEHRIVRGDGVERTVLEHAEAQRDGSGRLVRIVGVVQDITARKRAEAELRESEERFRHLANNIAQLAWMADGQGSIVWYNARWFDYTGTTLEDVKGWGWQKVHHPDHVARVVERIRRSFETGEPWEDTFPLRRHDGEYRWFLSRAVPIRDEAGRVTRWFGTNTDVTEQLAAEDALRAAHARLEEVDRRKTQFLAMLSHELRNPLAPIRNSIYLLEHAAPDSEQATRARDVIRRQTEHLTRLVDDLLDVTRISHGKIPLERSKVDLREIVRKTTDDLYSVFTQAGIDLRVDHVTAGPMWIEADPTRMAQVLANLLNNAIKFTSSGGTVRVSVAARDRCAELRVVDDGIGMEPKDLEQMFEPFAQADHSLARTKGGLGLGLALVKSIVELHGGTVEAHSEGRGRGAEFVVRIPLVDAEAAPEKPRRLGARTTPRTILVIEDNVDGAQSLAEILELHGHRVQVARDGRSGIALARELRPDVILCDIGLPDVDGYEVAQTLRRDARLRDTRLVALSGYALPEDRRRAHDAGFDAHIPKPPNLDALMAALERDR